MKIALIGIGKMGSWFGTFLSKDHQVLGIDTKTQDQKLPFEVSSEPGRITPFSPDLVLNCVPLERTVAGFEQLLPFLPRACMLSDMASVKGNILEKYSSWGHPFGSIHPMFGPTFADSSHLRNENGIIISESHPAIKKLFHELFTSLGVSITELTFKEHDEMMAYSLTTPFVASLVFALSTDQQNVPGTTFRKHSEIARALLDEDPKLISEILFNPNSLARLDLITSRLEFLKHVIRARDDVEMGKILEKLKLRMLP